MVSVRAGAADERKVKPADITEGEAEVLAAAAAAFSALPGCIFASVTEDQHKRVSVRPA